MLFNSYIFIFLFLPVILFGYYGLNKREKFEWAQAFLVAMSMIFYAYYNVSFLLLMIFSIVFNFLGHRLLLKHRKKLIIIGLLAVNLGVLGYFKYYDFFVGNINSLFGTNLLLKKIVLPLGISFFTFQQISFLVDTYRGETKDYGFLEYALFVSFFPQLVAGPIVMHNEMIPQFRDLSRKNCDSDYLAKGFLLFTLGLFKKVILADMLGGAVDWGYNYMWVLDSTGGILISVCYTFQLYLDFSGYCDMAKGIASMLHITLPDNFDSPYQSAGIIEFWKRWHMTLGRFFTRYVYIPLGGSRRGRLKTIRNSAIVFLLSGLWHGADWTFVVWGALHGLGYILEYLAKPLWEKVPKILRVGCTFAYVNLAFVAFRAENVKQMAEMYRVIFTGKFGGPMADIAGFFNRDEIRMAMKLFQLDRLPYAAYYPAVFIGILLVYLLFFGKNAKKRVEECRFSMVSAVFACGLFVYCVWNLASVSTFLYFNF